jgi:hypothetical protein
MRCAWAKPDLLDETSRFVDVWKLQGGAWKLSRVISYGREIDPVAASALMREAHNRASPRAGVRHVVLDIPGLAAGVPARARQPGRGAAEG